MQNSLCLPCFLREGLKRVVWIHTPAKAQQDAAAGQSHRVQRTDFHTHQGEDNRVTQTHTAATVWGPFGQRSRLSGHPEGTLRGNPAVIFRFPSAQSVRTGPWGLCGKLQVLRLPVRAGPGRRLRRARALPSSHWSLGGGCCPHQQRFRGAQWQLEPCPSGGGSKLAFETPLYNAKGSPFPRERGQLRPEESEPPLQKWALVCRDPRPERPFRSAAPVCERILAEFHGRCLLGACGGLTRGYGCTTEPSPRSTAMIRDHANQLLSCGPGVGFPASVGMATRKARENDGLQLLGGQVSPHAGRSEVVRVWM